MSLTDLPVLFVPSIPEMGVGLIIVPIVCVTLLILLARHWCRSPPRPYGLVVFFAVIAIAVIIGSAELYWEYSLHTLIAMGVVTLGLAAEVATRRLWNHWNTVAGAVVVGIGYYFFLLSAVASAAV